MISSPTLICSLPLSIASNNCRYCRSRSNSLARSSTLLHSPSILLVREDVVSGLGEMTAASTFSWLPFAGEETAGVCWSCDTPGRRCGGHRVRKPSFINRSRGVHRQLACQWVVWWFPCQAGRGSRRLLCGCHSIPPPTRVLSNASTLFQSGEFPLLRMFACQAHTRTHTRIIPVWGISTRDS